MKLTKEILGEVLKIEAIEDIGEWDRAVLDFERKHDCDFQAPCLEVARRLYEGWDVLESYLKYIDRQKQQTIILQKAASAARKGDRETAMRLKSQVDTAPRVYDGANLLPAIKQLIGRVE